MMIKCQRDAGGWRVEVQQSEEGKKRHSENNHVSDQSDNYSKQETTYQLHQFHDFETETDGSDCISICPRPTRSTRLSQFDHLVDSVVSHRCTVTSDDVPNGLEYARGIKQTMVDDLLNEVGIQDRAQLSDMGRILVILGV